MPAQLSSELNNIIQFLYDSYESYKNYVDSVSDIKLRLFFNRISEHRLQMIREVQANIPETSKLELKGTLTGKFYLFYKKLKSLIAKGDLLSITKELKRGENTLIEYYKEALNSGYLLKSQHELLKRQMQQIEEELKQSDLLAINVSTH